MMQLLLLLPVLLSVVLVTGQGYAPGGVQQQVNGNYQQPPVQHVQQYHSAAYGNGPAVPQPALPPSPAYGNVRPNYAPRPQPSYNGQQMAYGQPSINGAYGGQAPIPVPVYGGPAAVTPNVQYPILVPTSPTCPFDPQCFKASPECTISNAYPFDRRTPISCQECLNLCQEKQFGDYPYICRSVVPTGLCQAVATEKPTTSSSAQTKETCPNGKLPKISEIVDYGTTTLTGASLQTKTAEDCATACLANQDESGNALELNGRPCRAASFSNRNGCQLSSNPLRITELTMQRGVTTYKIVCFPEELLTECPGNFFYDPHHVLVGFAKQVVTARDETDCVEQCLQAYETTGFNCMSGMFYFSDSKENCILNTEDRKSQSDVYTEDDADVVYFESGCFRRRLMLQKHRKLDAPIVDDEWTEWSACNEEENEQIRFKRCEKKDIRDCPHQRRKCKAVVNEEKLNTMKKQKTQ
ncbi:Uncharacterized protein T4A_287 [Trichinella pseudospiralis]|uniref:Apple domain-containing protein n=2 Tax=Trichinella pseudospiralis TaxID=6337 RepID=A0A0V1E0G2_TRIPS|nr:Uncharacterized protein T4A_287 [Trichinella pseudospiralis]